MDAAEKTDPPKPHPEDNAAEMDAAVSKAEDAEKRLRRAEDGPLETLATDGPE